MAEVIGIAILGALGTSAGAAGAAVGISAATAATLVGTTALITGSLAVSALIAPDQKQKVTAQQYASKQSLPPRRRAWGRVKLSGPYVAWDSTGGAFYTCTYLGEGPFDAIEEVWLDDTKTFWVSGATSGIAGVWPWINAVALEARLGTDAQTAISLLLDLPYWTADHRLLGGALLAMRATAPEEERFKEVYPSGSWPQTRAVVRAAKVRNPNDPAQTNSPGTWEWSELCAPCIRDILIDDQWGFKVPASLIDDDSFAAAAAVDAQTVTDKAGNTIKRYRLAGTYDLTDEPANALQGMLDACDRTLYLTPEGKIGITGGRYVAPDVTIGQNAVISIGSLEIGNGKRATFNRLKTSFLSPLHDYQVIEGDPWVDQAAIDEAGETLEADFSRPWVVSHNQLRRLAKIHAAKQNPRYRITGLVTSRKGLPALYEDSVTLNLPRYGISGPFRIDRAVAAGDGSTCTFDLTSIDPDAYSFNPATEEGVAPPLPNVNTGLVTPPPPTGLTTLVERRVVNGTTTATFVRLLCTEPARLDLSLIGRYRRVGDTAWLQMAREGANRGSVISSVLADGETYEFQGALATYGRSTQSAWTPGTPLQVVATADAAAPAAPTYNSATRSGGTVTHVGRFPNSANARRLRLRRALGHGAPLSSASVVDTQAGGPNQSGVELTDSIGLGLWRYWLDCLNGSGVASDPAPQSPREILYAVPAGNLLTAPYDFTDAAWTKSNATAAAGGAGPDGNGASAIRETAASGTHYVSQTATITAGRHRFAIGIKADGRSRAQLRLGNGDLSSYASAVFNLSTEGIGTVNYTGSAVTNGVASLIRVSADYWLAIIAADIAAASATARLLTVNDANSASYAGDTSKGLGLWAASLGPA